MEALFSELDQDYRLDLTLPEGTRIGHMHLYGSDLEASMKFYREVLGFQAGPMYPSFRMGEVGLDDQQPHVIAWNTWKGTDISPVWPIRWVCATLPSYCPMPASYSGLWTGFGRPAYQPSKHQTGYWCVTHPN